MGAQPVFRGATEDHPGGNNPGRIFCLFRSVSERGIQVELSGRFHFHNTGCRLHFQKMVIL